MNQNEEIDLLNEVSYLKSEIRQRENLLTEKEIDKSNPIENNSQLVLTVSAYDSLCNTQNELIKMLHKINTYSGWLITSMVSIIIFLTVLLWILLFIK